MPNKTAGIIVEYQTKDGKTQRGIERYCDQAPETSKYKKLVIRLTDEKTNLLDNGKGGNFITLKAVDKVKKIGFVD